MGGKNKGTTVTNTYQPTEYELEYQKTMNELINAYKPNALWLNDVSRWLMEEAYPLTDISFSDLNDAAQSQITNATKNLQNIPGSNQTAAANANVGLMDSSEQQMQVAKDLSDRYRQIGQADTFLSGATNQALQNYINQTAGVAQQTNQGLNQLVGNYGNLGEADRRQLMNYINRTDNIVNQGNAKLEDISKDYRGTTTNANEQLSQLIPENQELASNAMTELGNVSNDISKLTGDNYEQLINLGREYGANADETNADLKQSAADLFGVAGRTNNQLYQLQQGNVGNAWQQNMEESIRNALQNTMGKNLNELASRGILNSSVTNEAINDIQKNAANTVAEQYQNNINQQADLISRQFANQQTATQNQEQMTQQAYDNMNTALGKQGDNLNLAWNNALNSLGQQMNVANSRYNIGANDLSNRSNLYQTEYSNLQNALNAQNTIANQQTDRAMSGLNQQNAMTQQGFQNQNQIYDAQGNLINQGLSNSMNAINQGAALTNQQDTISRNLLGDLSSLYGKSADAMTDAIAVRSGAYQQGYQNTLGANTTNADIYNQLIGNAGIPINVAATAQQDGTSPALNLWNASTGLGTGVTYPTGQGTTSQTTKQGSGNIWSGAIGGVASGLGMAAGGQLFCFTAGTKIKMKEGYKSIEAIEKGDEVINPITKGVEKVKRRMNLHQNHVYRLTTDEGKQTITTKSQPILTADNKFIALEDLKIGDELKNAGNIVSIEYVGYQNVYDIELDGENVYEADGFISEGGSYKYWKE